jgi:hypothetical protein
MPAGNTYEAIATQTLGSAAASVTFSSIPSTYTDLIVVINGAANANANGQIQFNGDTGTNYSFTWLSGDGSSAQSGRSTSTTRILLNYYGYFGTGYSTNMIAQVQNYSNTTTNKTVLVRGNNASNGTAAVVGMWANTAAITSVTITTGSSTFTAGNTFTLYGIKAF